MGPGGENRGPRIHPVNQERTRKAPRISAEREWGLGRSPRCQGPTHSLQEAGGPGGLKGPSVGPFLGPFRGPSEWRPPPAGVPWGPLSPCEPLGALWYPLFHRGGAPSPFGATVSPPLPHHTPAEAVPQSLPVPVPVQPL
jgi:hypothetical protein